MRLAFAVVNIMLKTLVVVEGKPLGHDIVIRYLLEDVLIASKCMSHKYIIILEPRLRLNRRSERDANWNDLIESPSHSLSKLTFIKKCIIGPYSVLVRSKFTLKVNISIECFSGLRFYVKPISSSKLEVVRNLTDGSTHDNSLLSRIRHFTSWFPSIAVRTCIF